MFLDIIRYTPSDQDLGNYIKSYVESYAGREGLDKMMMKIGNTIHYLLRKWEMKEDSVWSIYGESVDHFANNYFC